MSFWKRTGSKEAEDGEIVRQGDGHDFLGCTRNYGTDYLKKGQAIIRAYYLSLLD